MCYVVDIGSILILAGFAAAAVVHDVRRRVRQDAVLQDMYDYADEVAGS